MAIQEVIIESLAVKHISNVGFTTIGKDFTQEDRLAPNPHTVLSKEIPAEEWQSLTPAQAVALNRVEKHVVKLTPDPTTGTPGNEKAFYSVESECIEPGHSARGPVFTQGFLTVPGSADWIVELFEDNGSGTGPDYGSPITLGKGNSWAIYPPTGILWLEAGNTLNSFTKPFWLVGYTYVGKTLNIFDEQEQGFNNLVVNSSFDHWFNSSTVPDGWEKGAGDTSEELSDVIFGNGALRFEQVPGAQFWIRQYPIGFGIGELKPGWAGKDVTFSVYAKATSTTKTLLLRLEDGVTATQEVFTVTDEWQRYRIVHRLDSNADRIRVFIAPEAVGVNATTTVTLLVDGAMLSFGSAYVPWVPRTINDTHNNNMYGNLVVEGTSNLRGDVTAINILTTTLETDNLTANTDFTLNGKLVDEIEEVISDNEDALPTSSAVWDYVEGKLIVPDPTGEDGKFLVANGGTYGWSDTEYASDTQAGIVKTSADIGVDVNGALEILKEMLPAHTTNGAFLISDGVDTASWSTTQYATDTQAGLVKTSADIGVDVNGALELLAETLPDQSGHTGQFLVTNGSVADWTNTQWATLTEGGLVKASADIGVNASTGEMELLADTLPDQTGHAGEFLVTDGNSADWTGTAYATPTQAGIVKAGTVIGVDGNGALKLNGMTTTYDDPNYKIRVDGDFSITDHSGAAITNGSLKWDGTHFWGYVNGNWEILDQYSPFELDSNINWNPAPDPTSPPPNTSDIVGINVLGTQCYLSDIIPDSSQGNPTVVLTWKMSDDGLRVYLITYNGYTRESGNNIDWHDISYDWEFRALAYDRSNPSSPVKIMDEPLDLGVGQPNFMQWAKNPTTGDYTLMAVALPTYSADWTFSGRIIRCANFKDGQLNVYTLQDNGFTDFRYNYMGMRIEGNKFYFLHWEFNLSDRDTFYVAQLYWDVNNVVTAGILGSQYWYGGKTGGHNVRLCNISQSIDGKVYINKYYTQWATSDQSWYEFFGEACSNRSEIDVVFDISNPSSPSVWGENLAIVNTMIWREGYIRQYGSYLVSFNDQFIRFYDMTQLPGTVSYTYSYAHTLGASDYSGEWHRNGIAELFDIDGDDNMWLAVGGNITCFDISNLGSISERFTSPIDITEGFRDSGGLTGTCFQKTSTPWKTTSQYPYMVEPNENYCQVGTIPQVHSGAAPSSPFSDYANLNINGTIYAVNGIKVGDNVDPNVTDGFIRYHNDTIEARIDGSWTNLAKDLFDGTDITWTNSTGTPIPKDDSEVLGLLPVGTSLIEDGSYIWNKLAVSGQNIYAYHAHGEIRSYSYVPGSGNQIQLIAIYDSPHVPPEELFPMPNGKVLSAFKSGADYIRYDIYDSSISSLWDYTVTEDHYGLQVGDACYNESGDIFIGFSTDDNDDSGYVLKLNSTYVIQWSYPIRAILQNTLVYPQAMCADDEFVYFCYNQKLYILSQSSGTALLADFALSHSHVMKQMNKIGDYLFIGDGTSVYVWDISYITSPSLHLTLPGTITDYTWYGKSLFAIGGGSVNTYDVSNISAGIGIVETKICANPTDISVGQYDLEPTPIVIYNNGNAMQAGSIVFAPDTFYQYANMNVNGTIYAAQGVMVGDNTDVTPPAGMIRYNGGHFQGYNGDWVQLDNDISYSGSSYWHVKVSGPATMWTGTKIPDSGASSGQYVQSSPQATVTFDEGLFGSPYTVRINCKGNESSGNNRCDLILQYYDGGWQSIQTFDVLVTDDNYTTIDLGDVSLSDYPGQKRLVTSHTGDTGTHYLLIDKVDIIPQSQTFTTKNYLCEDPGIATYLHLNASDDKGRKTEIYEQLELGVNGNIAFGGTYDVCMKVANFNGEDYFEVKVEIESRITGEALDWSGLWQTVSSTTINGNSLVYNSEHFLDRVSLEPTLVQANSELRATITLILPGYYSGVPFVQIEYLRFTSVDTFISIPTSIANNNISDSFEIGNQYLSNGNVYQITTSVKNAATANVSGVVIELQKLIGTSWISTLWSFDNQYFHDSETIKYDVVTMSTIPSGTYRMYTYPGNMEILFTDIKILEEANNNPNEDKSFQLTMPHYIDSTTYGTDNSEPFTVLTGTGSGRRESDVFNCSVELTMGSSGSRYLYWRTTKYNTGTGMWDDVSGELSYDMPSGFSGNITLYGSLQLPAGQYRFEFRLSSTSSSPPVPQPLVQYLV